MIELKFCGDGTYEFLVGGAVRGCVAVVGHLNDGVSLRAECPRVHPAREAQAAGEAHGFAGFDGESVDWTSLHVLILRVGAKPCDCVSGTAVPAPE